MTKKGMDSLIKAFQTNGGVFVYWFNVQQFIAAAETAGLNPYRGQVIFDTDDEIGGQYFYL